MTSITSPSNRLSVPSSLCMFTMFGALITLGVQLYTNLDVFNINNILVIIFTLSGLGLGISLGLVDLKIYKKESWRIAK